MSQISPPIRILLVAVIGLIAVYMLFLRPKTEEAVPAAAPAATTPVPAKDPGAATSSGSGAVVQNAVKRTTDADAQAKVAAGETPGGLAADETTPTTGVAAAAPATGSSAAEPAPVTKETLRSLPKDVRRAVRQHKVIVLLFYNNRSSDDRAVRRALNKVDGYGGQVFVDAHWIKSVSRYQAIARGVDVEQSPTIVVADRNLKAETLVGFVDDKTIDQAVVDALVASGGSLLKNPYYRKIDALCGGTESQFKALPKPASPAALPAYIQGAQAITIGFKRDVTAVKPAKRYRRFHKHFVDYATDNVGLVAAAQVQLKANPAGGVKIGKRLTAGAKKLDKRFIAKYGAHGLRGSCF
jgi:hypothetical protein